MGKLRRTLELAKASAGVIKADKELLLLPVLSFLASAVVGATFLVPTVLIVDQESPVTYVVAFIAYVALAYVTIFFNTALVSAADERLQGGNPPFIKCADIEREHARHDQEDNNEHPGHRRGKVTGQLTLADNTQIVHR